MKYVMNALVAITALVAFMLFVSSVQAGTVINQVEVSGSGLTMGYTSLMESGDTYSNLYSDNLFAVGATYQGVNYKGDNGFTGVRQISGTNLRYSETVGKQFVNSSKTSDAPCAPINVDYKNINAGSQYNLDNGTIKTGADYSSGSVGYMTTGNGTGSGTVWNSITEMMGQIAGCGDTIGKALTLNTNTNYGSTYTANGNIDIASLFKFQW